MQVLRQIDPEGCVRAVDFVEDYIPARLAYMFQYKKVFFYRAQTTCGTQTAMTN